MPLTGMIWDLDGTLADTLPVCIGAFRHIFEQYLGRQYSDEEIAALFGASEEGTIRQLMPNHWREVATDCPRVPHAYCEGHVRVL